MNLQNIQIENFNLYALGDITLLNNPKVAIVGSRKATKYSKEITYLLAKKLSGKFTVISGGALGIDTEAHKGAFPNTIFVSPSSLDKIYPKSNENLIKNIYKDGLALSLYEKNFMPRKYTFLERNRVIIELCDFVIIPEAEMNSGSMRSFEIAKELGKKVYVIPQRLTESSGTRYLAKENLAEVIWDVEEFCQSFGINEKSKILTYDEAYKIYGEKLFEMEILGEIEIKNGKVYFS